MDTSDIVKFDTERQEGINKLSIFVIFVFAKSWNISQTDVIDCTAKEC